MPLNNDQKITYLANVIAVARANGQLSPRESGALEQIQKRIAAKKSDLNKAHALAESSDFKMCPVGHFVDKVQNLEDLIYVSMVDGAVDETEKPFILEFAKQIGVSQGQLNAILRDVKTDLTSEYATTSCSSCGAQIDTKAKFCPQCGASIADADKKVAVSVSYEIPKSGIAIEFAESTASGFVHAVKVAKTAPANATCLRGKQTWYLAAWPLNEIVQATKLAENLKGMRNRKVYLDGQEAQWEEVFGFSWCADQRNSAYRPIEYCFGLDEKRLNVWGCKQARMDWTQWADWFGYGSFKKTGLLKNQANFVFDKERIKHELLTNLHRFRFCPHLNFDLIQAVIEALPVEVTPSESGPWVYKRDYEESPGSIKVKMKVVEDGDTYTDEFFSSGVAPKSSALGLEILRKAFDTCGIGATELRQVLAYKG